MAGHPNQHSPMGHTGHPLGNIGHSHPHAMGVPLSQQQMGPNYGEGLTASYPQPSSPLQPLPAYNYPPVGNHVPHMPPSDAYSNEDAPMDEAMLGKASPPVRPVAMEPPDEPPSLSKRPNPEQSHSFSTGDPLATFSSDHQNNQMYSSEDNHGESYEDNDYYAGAAGPTTSESRDSYGHDERGGVHFHNHHEAALSPAEYSSYTGPTEPPYRFEGSPGRPQHMEALNLVPDHENHYDVDRYESIDHRHHKNHPHRGETYHYEKNDDGSHDDEYIDNVQHQLSIGSDDGENRYEHPGEEMQPNESSFDSYGETVDENKQGRFELPPTSPQSQLGSEHVSHTSSAMRGAQELLKRNRQKRLEMAARRTEGIEVMPPNNSTQVDTHVPDSVLHPEKDVISPQSATTWESSSEVTSVVSGTSSAWTDGSAAADRSSRRALILQMAKARMKKNNTARPIDAKTNTNVIAEDEEEKKLDSAGEDDMTLDVKMTRTNSLNESGTDIDISQDLD